MSAPPDVNLHLTPIEHGFLKAYTRYALGARPSRPVGSSYARIPLSRRREIERSVDYMLRGIVDEPVDIALAR